MMFLAVSLLLVTLILVGICLVLYARRNYGTLENCGFPVIPPSLFLGSEPDFYKEVPQLKDIERYRKYGPIWGLYSGQTPTVYVCDPELIRLILVKDHEFFHGRPLLDFGSPMLNEILDYIPGEKWRTVRTAFSPLFTTSKLRKMADVMTAHALEYMDDLKLECQETGRVKYDCKPRHTTWQIDMFAQSIFGIQLPNRKDANNPIVLAFRKMLGEDLVYGPLYSLTTSFPFLRALAPTFDDPHTKLIESTFMHVLESYRDNPPEKRTNDWLNVFSDLLSQLDTERFQKLGITRMTILAQVPSFFIGAYETTSSALSHYFYYLAKNPNVQNTLYDEIFSKFGGDYGAKTDHDSIREENTPYLTASLNEALRLAPPAKPDRICTRDWTDGHIKIKRGTEVIVTPFATHRNPKIYPDPDEYKPERFLPENKRNLNPYAFVPFGHGPQNCMGMRFALESMKTFMVHFMLNFKLEMRPDTVLNYKKGSKFFLAIDPLYVDIVPRFGE